METRSSREPLIPLAEFRRSGRCPVSLYHLLFNEKGALIASGALVPFGRRYLVDEGLFFRYLRERSRDAQQRDGR